MKKYIALMILSLTVGLGLSGCGKSKAELAKEEQAASRQAAKREYKAMVNGPGDDIKVGELEDEDTEPIYQAFLELEQRGPTQELSISQAKQLFKSFKFKPIIRYEDRDLDKATAKPGNWLAIRWSYNNYIMLRLSSRSDRHFSGITFNSQNNIQDDSRDKYIAATSSFGPETSSKDWRAALTKEYGVPKEGRSYWEDSEILNNAVWGYRSESSTYIESIGDHVHGHFTDSPKRTAEHVLQLAGQPHTEAEVLAELGKPSDYRFYPNSKELVYSWRSPNDSEGYTSLIANNGLWPIWRRNFVVN